MIGVALADVPLASALSEIETHQLQQYEEAISVGLQTFVEVGTALLEIRDRRLYRGLYRTFEEYCRERWQMSKTHANRLIDGAGVAMNLTPIGVIPGNEAQARPMAELAPDEQRLVWSVVRETAPDGKVTAAHVKSVVGVLKEITQTRAIDNGEGEAIPIAAATTVHLKAAVTEETYERMMRQSTHIRERAERRDLPHVTHNSGQSEWYTPGHLIDAARRVMGSIDLDPASAEIANRTVRASAYYTIGDDGLLQAWRGNVWLNPPYSQPDIEHFADKVVAEISRISQICILVNNATETTWFQALLGIAHRVCLLRGRVKFLDAQLQPNGSPLQGQVILYAGENTARFADVFSEFGVILDVCQR